MDRTTAFLDKVNQFKDEAIERIKLGVTDIDGVLRGKYISIDKFAGMADGAGFCDCVLGWDVNDQLYDNATFTGWHTAFPDATYRLDLSSERRLPDENNTPYFIGEFVDANDQENFHSICPRSLLKKVLAKANDMGFDVNMAFEYEFFVFKETPHTVREKNYQNLTPLTPGNFGYSVLRASSMSDLFHEFMAYSKDIDCSLEGLHCETGPGVWEAAIGVDQAVKAADKAALFKTFSKSFFQKRELIATFMAKWSMDYPGQSGHCHQSLVDLNTGKNVFFDSGAEGSMSNVMRQYVAGLHKYLKPFLAMYSPTVNSYTRLVKGAWAPTATTWGIENRTAALRVIPGSEKSQRVEFRVGSADANPYLVAAANIASGLMGIQQGLSLDEGVKGNAYEVQENLPAELQFPTNLRDSVRHYEACSEAREIFGQEFVDHYISSRLWEVREYERFVNDWQLQRYFEII